MFSSYVGNYCNLYGPVCQWIMRPVTFGLAPYFFYFIDPDPQGQDSDGNIADAHDDSCTDAPQGGKPLQGPQDRDTEYENTAEINNQGGFCFPKVVENIAQENGIEFEKVLKENRGSEVAVGEIREVHHD